MNQEAVFALRFVLKDLAKMRKGIEQMNKNIENLKDTSSGASKNLDKVNTSMGKATRSVLKFAAAYFTLSRITSTIFSKAHEAMYLQGISISAGIAADKIGKLGSALKRYGGDARSAGAAYTSLTNIIGGATHGMGISEDVMRVNAMYGIGFNYGNISQEGLMTNIAKAMHRLKGQGDSFAIQQIAGAYGLGSDVTALLAEHGANWRNVVSAEDWKMMNMSDAQKQIKASNDLQNAVDNAVSELTPALTQLIGYLKELTPILGDIASVLNNTIGKLFKIGEKAGRWIGNKYADYMEPVWREQYRKEHPDLSSSQLATAWSRMVEKGQMTQEQFDYLYQTKIMPMYLEEHYGIDKNISNVANQGNYTTIELLNNSGNKLQVGKVDSDGGTMIKTKNISGISNQ